ncbi:DUF1080 domain-containing protein [Niabella yanshanensis]|uniref:DUF1080 domain-containing protein n=1 Tax=Niabella yanshanensis TaxID=577386 RepID=A0ABZ0W7T1_9BACT|nr:DUF1080 domain-containing protein [Niabella yanshanensis]WQD38594.1 DUF1080 domain-containing protein [Niabella yanshanensis]
MKQIIGTALLLAFGIGSHAQKGWQSLFDGKTLAGWNKVAGAAKYMIEDNAIVGVTVVNTPNTFLLTDKTYSDFILELDVKIEDNATNSGIQFRSNYDASAANGKGKVSGYQYELDPSPRAWTGGIYDEARRGWLYPLDLNDAARVAYKKGQYNRVRIECKGAVTQTFVNGIPAAILVDTMNTSGYIALQVHSIGASKVDGQKIYWKNIRVNTSDVKLSPVKNVYTVNNIPNNLSSPEKSQGWSLLFDGKTMKGWRSAKGNSFPSKGWGIENGELKVLPSDGAESMNGGDIVTNKEYAAFDLTFQFKLTPGANSGVKYYVTLKEKNEGSAIGPEYQILDDKLHPDAKLGKDGNRTMASLYDLIASKKDPRAFKAIGQWNTGRILAQENGQVTYFLNGIPLVQFVRGSEDFKKLVAGSKYKEWQRFGEAEKGHILLQDHGNEVSFRSIKVKELSK